MHVVPRSVTTKLLAALEGFCYNGDALNVRPTDCWKTVPLRDPPDQ